MCKRERERERGRGFIGKGDKTYGKQQFHGCYTEGGEGKETCYSILLLLYVRSLWEERKLEELEREGNFGIGMRRKDYDFNSH